MDFLSGFLMQLFSTAGVIFIFGSLIALLRRGFCSLCGRAGPKILLATGIIGTPIHELSHALMCILFGHKITEIKLYQPRSTDGALGYVNHTYSKKNIYHQIGNFFIGIAPILIGGGVFFLLMLALTPDAADIIFDEIGALSIASSDTVLVADYFEFLISAIGAIFSAETLESWQGWLFITLAIMISSHMEMSGADIKSGLKGLLFVSVLLLVVDAALYFIFSDAFASFNEITVSFGLILSAFLSLSLVFLTVLLLIAVIFKGIISVFKH